jgi:hypothetical protein
MKIVYVVTGSANSHYVLMTRISIATLKISNPSLAIVLATDNETLKSIKETKNPILTEVSSIKEIQTPSGSSAFRSRFIKTRLGIEIEGSFIFVDSDTVIRKKITFDLESNNDIGLVRNHSRYILSEQLWIGDLKVIRMMGWNEPQKIYFNSGVIFYQGNSKSKKFAEKWHEAWKEGYKKTGFHVDQPSLSHIISLDEFNVQPMGNKYNSQVKSRLNFKYDSIESINEVEKDAVIWHYFYSDTEKYNFTEFELLVKKLSKINTFKKSQILKLLQADFPWRCSTFLDRVIAKKASKLSRIKGFYLFWLEGRKIKAIKSKFLTK